MLLPRRTESEWNITTFEGRRTTFLRFELSNKVQSNVAPALTHSERKINKHFELSLRKYFIICWLWAIKSFIFVFISDVHEISASFSCYTFLSISYKLAKLSGSWSSARNSFARKICSTRFYFCSTPFEQMTKKVKNARQSKNICRTCISSSFTFRQKNINCSNCKWST